MKYVYKIVSALCALAVLPLMVFSPMIYYYFSSTALQGLFTIGQLLGNETLTDAMEKFGLRRGVSGKITKAHHESSRRWHASQAEKEERLEAYEKKFGTEATWDFDMVLEFRRLKDKNKTDAPPELKVSITDKTK